MMTRRTALKTSALVTAVCAATASSVRISVAQQPPPDRPPRPGAPPPGAPPPKSMTAENAAESYKQPPLPYPMDALEPYIDAKTMEIHHGKHHATYVANLEKVMTEHPELSRKPLPLWLGDLNAVPEKIRHVVRNNGGGHYNHSLFWKMMRKGGGGEPRGEVGKAIERVFGGHKGFKEKFTEAALGVFGSGWVWLVMEKNEMKIVTSPNQDPVLIWQQSPMLGLDVWEHAYYLKHQNRRKDYIEAWWNVVNWEFVSHLYDSHRKA